MSYIAVTNYTVQNTKGVCTVKIDLAYGQQIPDIIQVYVQINDSPATLAATLNGASKTPTVNLTLACGGFYTIDVYPRMIDKDTNTLADKQPDENGVLTYFEVFKQQFSVATPSKPPQKIIPLITKIVPVGATLNNPNRLIVDFTDAEAWHEHNFWWGYNGLNNDGARQIQSKDNPATLMTLPSFNYMVKMQGVDPFVAPGEWSAYTAVLSAPPTKSLRFFFQQVDCTTGIKKYLNENTSLKFFMGL